MGDLDDDWPNVREHPDWHLEGKGVWTLRLEGDDAAVVSNVVNQGAREARQGTRVVQMDRFDEWQVAIYRAGKRVSVGCFSEFEDARTWAERELYGRPTAWERL